MSKGHGRALVAPWAPEPEVTRREPLIDYFMGKWWGMVGSRDALLELGEMVRKGLPLSEELIDHMAARHVRVAQAQAEGARRLIGGELPRPPKPDRPSWVYFIRVGDRVKIGTSVDPASRAVALSLRVKDVLAVMQGDRKLERSLHVKFAGQRIEDTEWFTWSDEIATFIDEYADPFTKDHRAYKPGAREHTESERERELKQEERERERRLVVR